METVPIRTVVGICTGFLSIIGGIIIWSLTKLQSDIKDNKSDFTQKQKDMKDEINKKADLALMESRFNSVDATLKRIEGKLDSVQTMQISALEDLAFIKGKEEARREMLSK
ncbi:MAG: hypothetical protein H7196_01630 [candidate division SR1 bacterium]|nr:hypothetical protein [candidate division SR1 bacterium]